jgi:replicative DNA helicase
VAGGETVSGIRNIRSGFEDYRTWATDPTPRIGLGLPFFDKPTNGGLAKAECAMVLAYSSVGKTSLGLNWIVNNPAMPTVFFSLEMSWRLVVARLAGIYTGTPTFEFEEQLRQGVIPPQLTETENRFPFLLGCDSSEMSIRDMAAAVKKSNELLPSPVRLIVIDYMELIGGAGMLGKSEQVDKAAQKVRSLAKDTDTSVVVLHQVAKSDGSGGHESLALDSGKYGGHHTMDYVIGAYAPRLNRNLSERERNDVQGDIFLQLLKNRNGKAMPEGVKHHLDPRTGVLKQSVYSVPTSHSFNNVQGSF